MISRALLFEGGAVGHVNHPFEDFELTFGDLKRIVELGLEGRLDVEAPVTEKLDGQQISVSYVPNRGVIFARNKSHMKDRGLNALSADEISEMFANRGDLTRAFTFAARDLRTAVEHLPNTQKESLFDSGKLWASVEIIFPTTQNVVPYGHTLLVFHHIVEVDDTGEVIGIHSGGDRIATIFQEINRKVLEIFTFKGPNIITFPRAKNFSIRKNHYISRINRLQLQFRLTDNDQVILLLHR